MTAGHDRSGLLDTGLLVQYLHGELDDHTRTDIDRHIAGCDACREHLITLSARLERLSSTLHSAAFDVPAESAWYAVRRVVHADRAGSCPSDSRYRRAAGWIFLFAAAGSLAVTPVRAWIAGQWSLLAGRSESAPAPTAAPAAGSASVTFDLVGPELRVTFAERQSAGHAVVRFTDTSQATISVSGGGTERISWSRDEVRVDNGPDATASYTITLSRRIDRVVLRVGGAGPIRMDRAGVGEDPIEINLEEGVRNRSVRDEL